jgi:hypothetical protein
VILLFVPCVSFLQMTRNTMEFDDHSQGAHAFLLNDMRSDNMHSPKERRLTMLMTLLAVVAASSIMLNFWQYSHGNKILSWKPSDMEDARSVIRYEERMYTGALTYNETAKQIVRILDDSQQYVGPPSMEITQAWRNLLRGWVNENIKYSANN